MLKLFIFAVLLTAEKHFVKTVAGVDLSRDIISAIKITGEGIRNSINENGDPCIDYFDYICGGSNRTEEFAFSVSVSNRLYDKNIIVDVLKKYLPKSNLIDAEIKLGNFVRSCKYNDTKTAAKDILKNYDFFHAIRSWPAFDPTWTIKEFDFVMLLAELRSLQFNLGIEVEFTKKENKRILTISPEVIDRNYEAKHVWRKNILEQLDIEKTEEILRDVEKFESEYTSVVRPQNVDRLEINYGMLKSIISEIDWDEYFQIASGTAPDNSYPVIIENLKAVKVAITTITSMNPKIVVNYVFYKFMHRTYQMMFYSEIKCYDYAFLGFQSVFTRLLANNFYTGEYNLRFFSVMSTLIETLNEHLELFERPNEEVILRLEDIFYNKILPSLTDEHLNRSYVNLHIHPRDYWGNIHRMRREFIKQKLTNFLKEKDIQMEIVNKNFISYILSRSLYEFKRKPTALLFDSIAAPVIAEAVDWLRKPTVWEKLNDTLSECRLKQLNIFLKSDIILIQGSQLYMDAYNRWAKKYRKTLRKEDDIFEVFGLTSKKVLFTKLNDICPYVFEQYENRRNLILEHLKHLKDFVTEYSCPVESSLTIVNTC